MVSSGPPPSLPGHPARRGIAQGQLALASLHDLRSAVQRAETPGSLEAQTPPAVSEVQGH